MYCSLGIPIIIADPIGAHEECNKNWLLDIGAGIIQGDPDKSDIWLINKLQEDVFTKLAINGYRRTLRGGLYNILDKLGIDHQGFHKTKNA